MQIIDVLSSGKNRKYTWPNGDVETYAVWIEYRARTEDGNHKVGIGYGKRRVYGKIRNRVVVWIDDYPQAEFIDADDFHSSGDVLSEIRVKSGKGTEIMCRYPDASIPERYSALNVVGLPTRICSKGVHNAWAVVMNIADHRTMIALAALKRIERI